MYSHDYALFSRKLGITMLENGKNGSILSDPQIRHMYASLDSVASAADGIQKEA